MMDIIDGKFDMSEVSLTREGELESTSFLGLSDWNNTLTPFFRMIENKGLAPRIHSLSRYYLMSRYCLEGERGFIHKTEPLNTREENRGLNEIERIYAPKIHS